MQPKILSKRILLITIIGFTFFSVFLFYFIQKSKVSNVLALSIPSTNTISQQGQLNSGLPLRLKIPKINVDSVIEYVGLTTTGAMDTPKNQENVAWFQSGARPGEIGSAVIAGHYGWKNQKSSAFDNLHMLQIGDKIYTEDEKGITISFVVKEIKKYNPEADTKDVFSSNDGKSHLNLITCEGIWDKVKEDYPSRLIIFTDREYPYND